MERNFRRVLDVRSAISLDRKVSASTALLLMSGFLITLAMTGWLIGNKYFWSRETRSALEYNVHNMEKLARNHESVENNIKLAVAYYMNDEAEWAIEMLNNVLRDQPEYPAANIYLGMILTEKAQYNSAIKHLRTGLQQAPALVKLAYYYLGLSYYNIGNLGEAQVTLEQAVKLNAAHADSYYYLGLVYKQQGRKAQAINSFKQALIVTGNQYPEALRQIKELSNTVK